MCSQRRRIVLIRTLNLLLLLGLLGSGSTASGGTGSGGSSAATRADVGQQVLDLLALKSLFDAS